MNASTGTSEKWTKDFVEHVRAVHFAVTALAVTLIVLAAPPDERLSKALSQAVQIERLSRDWGGVRKRFVEEAVRRLSLVAEEEHLIWVERPSATHHLFGAPVHLTTVNAPTQDQAPHVFPGRRMDLPPTTVSEFALWWNRLVEEGMDVNVVDLVQLPTGCEAWLEFRRLYDGQPVHRDRLDCRELRRDYGKVGDTTPIEMNAEIDYAHSAGPGFTVFASQSQEVTLAAAAAGQPPVQYLYVRESRRVEKSHIDIVSALALFAGLSQNRGQFTDAFPELASVPEDLRYVPLAEAVSRLRDLQPHAELQVEVIGLKIPTERLIQWGSLLLLAVQLYLWLHLAELNQRLARRPLGCEVAWIGVYRSRFALGVVAVTVCVLPTVAFWSLLQRAHAGLNFSRLLAAAGLLAGAVLGIVTIGGVRLLRSR